jgi:DNA modification methylase
MMSVATLSERERLFNIYKKFIQVNRDLDRTLVSFQANKKEPFYAWFKYKEGFSSRLVEYFLDKYKPNFAGSILDPFAGAGATLFSARAKGWHSTGIEVLPVGIHAITCRLASEKVDIDLLEKEFEKFKKNFKLIKTTSFKFQHVTITNGAFPEETQKLLESYMDYCKNIKDGNVKQIFEFAAFSILEEISYTRKDGQFLRWDYRSPKKNGSTEFNKGNIPHFKDAINSKLGKILVDLNTKEPITLFGEEEKKSIKLHDPKLIYGSVLEELPKIKNNSFDFIMTSPPYCNRYDYTRTYALELVYLGVTKEELNNLRQCMLSCTVENKDKIESVKSVYEQINKLNDYEAVMNIYSQCKAMQEVNAVLAKLNSEEKLNNKQIQRMVYNYFLEMAFVIYEMSRVLKNDGIIVMVNDNVRYGGEEIPVDLIMSNFAENCGLEIVQIWALPKGKGNSSQQMGVHGRNELRKCVYVWKKINKRKNK